MDALLLASTCAHVLLSPYNKVEESFNLHATHDVLMYGIQPSESSTWDSGGYSNLYKYDHFTFPGAVPRTFIGSVILAYLAMPFIYLGDFLGVCHTKIDGQVIVRLVLASINAFGLILIRRAVSSRFGHKTSRIFTLLTVSQFHLLFWMGRTLPNMFALFPVNLSTSILISPYRNAYAQRRASLKAICILVFTTIIFRAELALLLAPIVVQHLYRAIYRSGTFFSTVKQLIMVGGLTAAVSIALTTVVDSYFWGRFDAPLWPEFWSVWFNVVEGKSVEWGVSPYRMYLASSLPKLLLSAYPLSLLPLLAPVRRSRVRSAVFPYLTFVLLISCLAHKEWRFIIYVVPAFNISAAHALTWASNIQSSKSMQRQRLANILALPLRLLPYLAISANVVLTIILVLASRRNYPGGEIMQLLDAKLVESHLTTAHVHISNLAAQTGASLFSQTFSPPHLLRPPSTQLSVKYDKTESLSPLELVSEERNFTHLIIEESPSVFLGALPRSFRHQWEAIGSVRGFDRWVILDDSLGEPVKRSTTIKALVEGLKKLPLDPWNSDKWADVASSILHMEQTEKLWIVEKRS
ncbi:hypothetical protein ONZ45_g11520 [Pleurotus djamor]|nr:hypothetical protein ONZ45_g11520 [Pleurotus djamor]